MRAVWLVSGALVPLFASPAQATVSVSYAPETGVVVVGSDAGDRLHFERHDTAVYVQQINVGPDAQLVAGPGCSGNGFGTAATCETGSTTTHANVHLGAGDDELDDSSGISTTLSGDAGNDHLFVGGSGPVTIAGGAGDDFIQGTSAGDHLYGGTDDPNAPDGNDTIISAGAAQLEEPGSDGDDVISGGLGNDTIAAGVGSDVVDGGAGDDAISGCGSGTGCPDGDDILDGGDGNDAVSGRGGSDVITGGRGDDVLIGGDVSAGGIPGFSTSPPPAAPGGNDVVSGGEGSDRVTGGNGDDTLTGGPGDDAISGGDGADTIDAGPGQDRTEPGEPLMSIKAGINGGDPIPGDDGAPDDITCGSEADSAFPATGDSVSLDCESLGQELTCPPNVSGSCPITLEEVIRSALQSVPGSASQIRSATNRAVIGGTIVKVAHGTSNEAAVPLTAKGLGLLATAGRQAVQTRITVRDDHGRALSTRTVPYALDASKADVATVPRTADVIKIAIADRSSRLSVTVDVPAPGRLSLRATAPFRFGSVRISAAAAGRRKLVLKPSARALRELRRKHRKLKLSIRMVYTPTARGLGVASTREFAAAVRPPRAVRVIGRRT